jgi:predicted nucleic acid-binding Zn finger protein
MLTESQIDLISVVCNHCSSKETDNESILRLFDFVLLDNRKVLEAAVDILDNSKFSIKKFTSESSDRSCWKVHGSQGKDYMCLENFCSCQSYLQQAKQHRGRILCKHLLAVRLATSMSKINCEVISDEKFAQKFTDTE